MFRPAFNRKDPPLIPDFRPRLSSLSSSPFLHSG
jgi:hypothetical protein